MQSFFTAASAQQMFTRSLDVISNNLSNMQVTGFRYGFAQFQSVTRHGADAGVGARIANVGISTQPGDTRETGQELDLAIQGVGYFVLRDGDSYYYTRAGETMFNADQVLVHRLTQLPVQRVDENGLLQDISIADYQFLAPQPTTRIEFDGFISSQAEAPTSPPSTNPLGNPLYVINVKVFNALGEQVELKVEFRKKQFPTGTPPQAGVYTLTVTDKNGIAIGAFGSFDLTFDAAGNVQIPNTQTITLPAANNGSAGAGMDIVFDFSKLKRSAVQSNATADAIDGRANQPLVSVKFNQKGELELHYADKTKETHHRLALAHLRDEAQLNAVQGGVYETTPGNVEIGMATEGRFGGILPRNVEASNVDMTEQFANLILQQRGFQACARVMNVASEMLEELYGRG